MNNNIKHKAGLFIGIGGSGIKSLARLKSTMYQLYKNAGEISKFDEHQFIFIDTDANDIQKINDDIDIKGRLDGKSPIDTTQFINIGRTVPQAVRNNFVKTTRIIEETEHFFSWMISEKDNAKFRLIEQTLSNGAGASRIDGRTGFFDNFNDIKNKITDCLNQLAAIPGIDWKNPDPEILAKNTNFWVISGTNGGTGSSMTLDILFLIERLFRDRHNGKPSIKLAILTPQPYLGLSSEIDNIRLNSFAFLWEVNEFKTNAQLRFRDAKSDKDTNHFNYLFATNDFKIAGKYTEMTEPWDLFDYCLAFDTQTKDRGKEIDVVDTFENVASTISTLACLNAGSQVNSNMINYIINLKNKVPNSVTTNSPSLIKGKEWGMFVAATGNKIIQKPLNEFTNYMRLRMKFEILKFGLIGESFEKTHSKSVDEQNTKVMQIVSERLLKDLCLPDTSKLELKSDDNNIYNIINKEISKITNPDELDIKERNFAGLSIGFKDGVFNENWLAIKDEIQSKIRAIKELYNSESRDPINKQQITNRINQNIRQFINEFVLTYGYQYVYDVLYKLDCDLESKDGSKYLGEFNLINIEEKITKEYSDAKLTSIESSIEACAAENKDLESFKSILKDYIKFQSQSLLLQIKKEIIELLGKGRYGLLDSLIISKNGERGLRYILGKLQEELIETNLDLVKLASSFSDYKDPLKLYLPPLTEMVDGSVWKKDADFDEVYKRVVSRDKNGTTCLDFGVIPARREKDSLENKLNEYVVWAANKYASELIDVNYFAEVGLSSNISWEDFQNSMFSIDVANPGFFETLVVQHSEVKIWKDSSLKKEFDKLKGKNPDAIKMLRNIFTENHILYPTISNSNLDTTCIYSGGEDLKTVAVELGFQESKTNPWLETNDNSYLSKLVFEVGHTLGEYFYTPTYAEFYEKNRSSILAFEKGCHIHKHFNQLDVNKTMLAVYPSFPIKVSGEFYAFNLALYDTFFKLLKSEKPDLYNLFFSQSDPMLAALGIGTPEILPLIHINNDAKNIIKLKGLNLNSTTKKIEPAQEFQINISGASGFGDFLLKTIDHNQKFKSVINVLSDCFKANETTIKSEFRNFLQEKHNLNNQLFLGSLSTMKNDLWSTDLGGTSVLLDLIQKVKNLIDSSDENIFK
jgi:hypothetical protein